jgi:hypothetical protein
MDAPMNRNRLKLWLYMLLFALAGAANLFGLTTDLAQRALREADASLRVGAAHLRESERLMALEASAVTALAVKNAELLEALFAAPPRAEPAGKKKGKVTPPRDEAAELQTRHAAAEAAARTAIEEAARRLDIKLPAGAFWAVASQEWVQKRLPAELEEPQRKEAAAFLRDAAAGTPRRGYARVNDGLWYGVAYPAGEGAALLLFLPLDLAWARSMVASSSIEITLDAGIPQLVTTAQPDLARRLGKAAIVTPGTFISEGAVPPVMLESPVKVRVPVLFVKAPAARALAVPLSGLQKGFLVLSVPTVSYFTDLARYQWGLLIGLTALLLIGLLLGVLVKTDVLPVVPASLVAAASKIERGDFSARAPEFLGALGTVAGALNKAAAVAQGNTPSLTSGDPFAGNAGGQKINIPAEPSFAFPAPADPPRSSKGFGASLVEPTAAMPLTAAARAAAAAQDPPAPPPPPPPAAETMGSIPAMTALFSTAPAAAPSGPPAGEAPVRQAPRPSPTATSMFQAVTPPAAAEESDEEHWRAIHAEFLRVRGQCNEPVEGLSYDRFRPKLEKNKQQLVERHACRTVRFSVYVKEGKAALRATPVK